MLIEDLGGELQKAHAKGVTLQTRLQQLKAESIEVITAVGKMREHAQGLEEVQNRMDLIKQAPPEMLEEQYAHRYPTE